MKAPLWNPIRVSACLFALPFALSAASASAAPSNTGSADNLVECRLPPQIRSLGRNVTYLAAGRQIRLSTADCKVRGGSYDGHGPGALAGREAPVAADGRSVVTIGGDSKRAACPGSGKVSGLSGAGTLSVRTGPGVQLGRADRLANGAAVFMCDWSADGNWVGVVYAPRAGVDCGVSEKITSPRPYAGSCRSGWVSAKYLR